MVSFSFYSYQISKGVLSVVNAPTNAVLTDNGGRRSGIDRRQFTYSSYIPERRQGGDRRKEGDRRKRKQRFDGSDQRIASGL